MTTGAWRWGAQKKTFTLFLHLLSQPWVGIRIEDWGSFGKKHTHTYTPALRPPRSDAGSGGGGSAWGPRIPKRVDRTSKVPVHNPNAQSGAHQGRERPYGVYITDSFSQGSASPAGPEGRLRRGSPSSVGAGRGDRGISLFTWINSGTELRNSERST